MRKFIVNHPYMSFFTLVFIWTWGIVFTLIFIGTDINNPTPQFFIGGLLCNISPSIIAFIITGIIKGKEGIRSLKTASK